MIFSRPFGLVILLVLLLMGWVWLALTLAILRCHDGFQKGNFHHIYLHSKSYHKVLLLIKTTQICTNRVNYLQIVNQRGSVMKGIGIGTL